MSKLKIILFLLIGVINSLTAQNKCFDKYAKELGKTLIFPRLSYFQSLELHFDINDGKLYLDSTFNEKNRDLFPNLVQDIESYQTLINCKNAPSQLKIKLEYSLKDTIYLDANELTITRNKLAIDSYSCQIFSPNSSFQLDTTRWRVHPKITIGEDIAFLFYGRAANPHRSRHIIFQNIFFQTPKGVTSFNYKDSEMSNINLCYQYACEENFFCTNWVTEGSIRGELINDVWEVEIRMQGLKEIQNKEMSFVFQKSDSYPKSN